MAAGVNVITRADDDVLWSVDEFINTRPFRRTRTNFQVHYYNRVVLLFTDIDKRYLDFIYADADILLATWDSGKFSPPRCRWKCRPAKPGQVCAAILLCESFRETTVSANCREARLVSAMVTDWITTQFLSLPRRREERMEEVSQLIAEYDRLSFLLGLDKDAAKLRDNVIETVQMVTGTAAENTATIGIETTASTLGHAAAGVVLAVFVDVVVTASMLARAKVRKDRGTITVRQYKREVRERLFQTGCQFVCGTTGTIVGQIVVPVPVVGAAIGGFVGSLVGLAVSLGVTKIHKVAEKARRRKKMLMLEKP